MEHELPLAQQVATPNLVAHYMSRIWNLNPLVNAVVEACAPEEEEAAEQDSFTEEQIISKAFFGLPFLVKDSLDVLGFHTTCGASVYEHNAPADGDCKLVALLKKLRAIPIGKTNVPFLSQDMQTFNEVYGTTFNPYDAKLSSGGSSGGSAAAIALGLAAFAIGTDWNGSLRIPVCANILLYKSTCVLFDILSEDKSGYSKCPLLNILLTIYEYSLCGTSCHYC
jgi:amidase